MTDERIGDRLWEALAALPEGAGVVFRHYATPKDEREALARRVAEICDDCRFTLAIAGNVALARSVGAALVHNPERDPGLLPVSRAAHSLEEARLAVDAGASMIFLSPMFETRSHPDREPLSRAVARQIVAACPVPVIALGGMDQARFDELKSDGFLGWAGIDAWVGSRRRYDR
jgi:thiamine-phosphate pyrophosphorylase